MALRVVSWTLVCAGVFLAQIVSAQPIRRTSPPFSLTASGGLWIVVGGGSLTFADGTTTNLLAGSVQCGPNATNYIYLDLQDFSYHAFPRAIHSGGAILGTVITSGSAITAITPASSVIVPANPIEAFKRKLFQGGRTNLYVVVAGDSLSADWSDRLAWAKALFAAPATNTTYQVPYATNCILDNVALGGSSIIWSWALLCSSSVYGVPGASFYPASATFMNRDVAGNLAAPLPTGRPSLILSRTPDLLIIGHGANGDTNWTSLGMETIIREYTSRGVPVIITTENHYTSGSFMPWAEEPATIKAVADRYGAAIADTYSYVWEKNVAQGTNTYGDVIHQQQSGHFLWAQAVRGVLNSFVQSDGSKNVGFAPRITLNPANGWQTNAPNWIHVQPAKYASTGSGIDVSGISPLSIATKVCGVGQSQAVQKCNAGGALYFSFPVASAVYLVTEAQAGTNMTIDIYRDVSHVYKTITVNGSGNGIQITSLFSDSEIRALNAYDWYTYNPPEYRPVGMQITANGSPFYLAAVLYLGPKISSINPSNATLGGSGWFTESWVYNSISYPQEPVWSNDTTNGTITVNFTGNGIIVPIAAGSAAGMISAWVDGEQLLNSRDMYLNMSGGILRYYTLLPRNSSGALPLWFGHQDHTLRLAWPGQNASVTTSVSQNRKAEVLQSLISIDNR